MDMYDGDDIKKMRERLGLTQSEYGAMLGVCYAAVSLWESGLRHPRYATMVKLNELGRKAKRPRQVSNRTTRP